MEALYESITRETKTILLEHFKVTPEKLELQPTRREFEGDVTLVLFPLLKILKQKLPVIGNQLGTALANRLTEVQSFNLVKGFLNLVISDDFYLKSLNQRIGTPYFLQDEATDELFLVEYASPNTNKPLHLGHIRNNLLGYSVSELLKASGKKVHRTQILNDRGIHICKSMLAWKKYGNDETPQSSGLKGDHLVGKYYLKFNDVYKEEVQILIAGGASETEARKQAPSLIEAHKLLQLWEAGDETTVGLWKKLNAWVDKGFEETYKNLGVAFDSIYKESETYLEGKKHITDGLLKGVFFKKTDGSVWIDLSAQGLEEKLVLRADGTSVYITQDIGTALLRMQDHPLMKGMIYTVGNEQDYHFKVLFEILKKLGYGWAKNLYHLSYGMVDLPEGKMKTREGTVVEADELMQEMYETAKLRCEDKGGLEALSLLEKEELYRIIGLGALKYYLLKVDPKKRILFNPSESVDFNGNTGPFIQYTYARIQSVLNKAGATDAVLDLRLALHKTEKELIKLLLQSSEILKTAALNYSPALIANYLYEVAKLFNSMYQNKEELPIVSEPNVNKRVLRVALVKYTGETLKQNGTLLGMEMPLRM